MRVSTTILAVAAMLLAAGAANADVFGTGANQFTMDFVPISGSTNPASGIPTGGGFTFAGVNKDYRMGAYEVTNDQWNKFQVAYGAVDGSPWLAYGNDSVFTGTNVPVNRVSWYEAAQFVNWLNTSSGHQAAYRFTGTQGTSDYTFATWSAAEADSGTNLYRHKDAFYYLPSEDEWVKAAYWNGTAVQTHATKAGQVLYHGNGSNGGWNYSNDDYPSNVSPWDVGSGSQELNGTYDMMGNIWEWTESSDSGHYAADAWRHSRGGSYYHSYAYTGSDSYGDSAPQFNDTDTGFRVASNVPEPASLALLTLGGLAMLRRRK